ncbi:hypothetical protein [Bradyrhizobium sp. CCBAU 051011]|uniref:hypothetical protein n=1 Tax=Bradyrhizobium sp. CCBAU 051011 TaxID=858422 RepID=UPI00137B56E5|nr:hypothetical protein [Bradyrhizobium sp. CCBAU 051011]
MTFTLGATTEKLTSFVLRADCTAGASVRLAITADGCQDCTGDIGLAPAPRPVQQGLDPQQPEVASPCREPANAGRLATDLTDTAAKTELIFPGLGVLLQQHRKGCPFEEESCR